MKRIERLLGLMKQSGVNNLLLTDPADIFYLSGFTGSTAYLFASSEKTVFFTDGRYAEQIKTEISRDIKTVIVKTYGTSLCELAKQAGQLTVSPKCPLNLYCMMEDSAEELLIDSKDLVSLMRSVKDKEEIELISHSFRVAGEAFKESLGQWRYGMTETEWAAVLEYNMRKRGAKDRSFETIIASGERSALPHGNADMRVISAGDPVTVDYGCKFHYCSDITRVVYDGSDPFVLEIADIVRGAMDAAKAVIRPGAVCSDVDKAARDFIEKKGYGVFFNHGLGHGVGIDVHEAPSFNFRDETVLVQGMVLTVEPGIYLPGRFGVRLEDTVAVSENSCVNLTAVLEDYVYKIHQR
ncbi:aminopeptidase P family protein [Geovibrio thiophilus]|uniref:Aminopeptidase P family protein n=1 Tax=Geovibrio thiophilus TaxID=139438 RepID=A0A3R5V0L4_9BACT|nr:Xaa-Pro peptidase family protein [Geovibrio thiophilus]QAR34276.1 aminopeptidase P family protein [Geovibrio thiophilus]